MAAPACSTCYQRGKDKQWDATKRIDWSIPVNPCNVMEQTDELNPIYGSRQWNLLSQKERDELDHHLSAWLFSQFLHGEQGALTVAARIVQSVPDMDSKFYAATQTMDEARHVELYARFMREKMRAVLPWSRRTWLPSCCADALRRLPLMGTCPTSAMQVADRGAGPGSTAFGVHRDLSNNPLVTQLLAYVMQGRRRGPARGVRPDRAARLPQGTDLQPNWRTARSSSSRRCYLMRNRFTGREVTGSRMGFDVQECLEVQLTSHRCSRRSVLCSSPGSLPCVKEHIGIRGTQGPARLRRLHGVIEARGLRLWTMLMRADEGARREDRQREVRGRAGGPPGREVDAAIAAARGRPALGRTWRLCVSARLIAAPPSRGAPLGQPSLNWSGPVQRGKPRSVGIADLP